MICYLLKQACLLGKIETIPNIVIGESNGIKIEPYMQSELREIKSYNLIKVHQTLIKLGKKVAEYGMSTFSKYVC